MCGDLTAVIDSGLPDNEENPAAMTKKSIGIIALSIIIVMTTIIGCLCIKKKKKSKT